ncbi:hypothetical protein BaOVIS_024790 [Babesia ovis]|uniref:Mic1 domain-containing protein n=1 Tax=Babesia ovis TaxID=5869 RepID=A0A9W5TBT9_BABOV|nr:hypothetical protein BaOVIS_024790 [Babesia ovis]
MAEVVLFKELYSWQNDHDQAVFVDGANGMVIYQSVYDKSLRVIDSCKTNSVFNSTRFPKPLCENIAFSPDGQYILYWHNSPLGIGVVDTSNPAAPDVIVDCSPYDETIVLSVFWSQCGKTSADFVVVCTSCIDIYNEVRLVTDIELSVRNGHKLQKSAITVATIYNDIYCIHKDCTNGTLSLRSMTNNKALDIVLEVRCQGWLDIAVCDNLILALTGGNETYIFDIAIKDKPLVVKVPQRKPSMASISSDVQVYVPNVVVDYYGGFAYNLTIDHNMLMLLLSQMYTEHLVIDFYQNRHGAVQRVMEMINTAMTNRVRSDKLLTLFKTIVSPYAKTLVDINNLGTRTANNVAIPFNVVEEHIGDRSIVTEYRFGKTILYPSVTKDWNLKPGENIFDAAITLVCYHRKFDFATLLKMRDEVEIESSYIDNAILRSKIVSGTKEDISSDFRDYLTSPDSEIPELYDISLQHRPYIVSAMLTYFRALITHHLQPTHLLQVLLFDICIMYNGIGMVLNLLRSKIIRDSSYVCYRLFFLYVVLRDPEIRQQCLDMSIRLKLYRLCVTIAMLDEDYYTALNDVKAYSITYPLHRILYQAAMDIDAQTRKPYLWPSMIAFITCWAEESASNPKTCPPPNLSGCEMWLPNL